MGSCWDFATFHNFSLYTFYIRIYDVTDDFKPASVDAHKEATLETGTNNQVTVTVPHLGGFKNFTGCGFEGLEPANLRNNFTVAV